uniref:interleukin-6 receptor subunit beta-like n=1 Tax=Myxine glutinosa TaxID=7769 RepID=UPI00358FFFE5
MGEDLLRYFLLLPGIITCISAFPEFLGNDHAIVINSSTLLRGSTLIANCLIKPKDKPDASATSTAHQHKDFYSLAPATRAFGERVNQSHGNNSIRLSSSDLSTTIPLYSTTSTFYKNSVFPSCSVNWKLNSTGATNGSPGTIYDDLSSRLTLNNFSVATAWLHCYIKCPDRPAFHLAKSWLRSGFPPQKPRNLSCILQGNQNGPLQCQFDAGLDPELATNYSLVVHTKSGDSRTFTCSSGSCEHTSPMLPIKGSLSMQVVASNDLGIYLGDTFNVSSSSQLVLPYAPRHLWLEPQDKASCCSLKASWNTEETFSYQLRYSVDEPGVPPNWKQITDIINNYTIHQLQPFHHYVAYLRHRVQTDGSHWSKWSQKARNRTSEKAPARSPDVWRVIDVKESGRRDVTIYWKNMTERELSGQLHRYRVDVWPGHKGLPTNWPACESLATECHVQLDSGSYTISVSVKNGAGWGKTKGRISIPTAGRIGERPKGLGQFLQWCHCKVWYFCGLETGADETEQQRKERKLKNSLDT